METYGAEEAFLTGTFVRKLLWTQLMAARLAPTWPMIEKIRRSYKNLVREDTA